MIDPQKMMAFTQVSKQGGEDTEAESEALDVDAVMLALVDAMDTLNDAALELAAGGDSGQPSKGLEALEAQLGEPVVSGLKGWLTNEQPAWEEMLAKAEELGAEDPEALAAWLQAVKEAGDAAPTEDEEGAEPDEEENQEAEGEPAFE